MEHQTNWLVHHGIKGQKWGVKNGPPYPLDSKKSSKKEVHKDKELSERKKRK